MTRPPRSSRASRWATRPRRAYVSVIVSIALIALTNSAASAAQPPALSGEAGIASLGDTIDAAAAKNGLTPAELRTLLRDDAQVRVDDSGSVFFVDASLPVNTPPTGPAEAAPFPYGDTFALHSRPGAQRVIYLDFNGQLITGTGWNDVYNGGAAFTAEAFDLDGNASTFSNGEMDVVQSVWIRVAEDYAPFDVDVTTEEPPEAAIDRQSAGDQQFGTRVLITNTTTVYSVCNCGGSAFLNAFDEIGTHSYRQPAMIFQRGLGGASASGKNIAEASTHEAGHTLGLSHDGTATDPYYLGHGPWAPIMGVSYFRPISQFSAGEYAGANNTQDDFAVMQSHGAPLRPDDHGDTLATATNLGVGPNYNSAGVISTRVDTDVFALQLTAFPVAITALPAIFGPNLDIRLDLLNSAGTVVATSDPPATMSGPDAATGLSASINYTVPTAGTYYIRIDGVGFANPSSTGYSDYGSVGAYTLSAASGPFFSVANRSIVENDAGDQLVAFDVSVSSIGAATPMRVDIVLADGTARDRDDYATPGQFTLFWFNGDPLTKTYTMWIRGDAIAEPNETFFVDLIDPVNGFVGPSRGTGTIVDNDPVGLLRVTTNPAVPSQITVDGSIRDTWGLQWLKIAPGAHQVCFSDVPGFVTPTCQAVNVQVGATTTVTGAFVRTGSLRVITAPAVASTISVDGVPRNDWGVWTDFASGSHQVCFGQVAGFNPPPCQVVNVNAGQTTTVTGTFAANAQAPGPTGVGFLRAYTINAVPATISIDGVARDTWGLTWLKLSPGNYQVCFGSVEGFKTPQCEPAIVVAGETSFVAGIFLSRAGLRVTTTPAVPGTIYVDGVPLNDWGVWTDIDYGNKYICFGPVASRLEPACQVVFLSQGQTTFVDGTYT